MMNRRQAIKSLNGIDERESENSQKEGEMKDFIKIKDSKWVPNSKNKKMIYEAEDGQTSQ